MGDLTEQEIFDCIGTNARLAAEHCDQLARTPQEGQTYDLLRKELNLIEGACRHLVKDRMEQTGMRWTVSGAQAMLHLRAHYLNGRWDEYVNYHVETEQAALYSQLAA